MSHALFHYLCLPVLFNRACPRFVQELHFMFCLEAEDLSPVTTKYIY